MSEARRPDAAGYVVARALDPHGTARRFALAGDDTRTLYRIDGGRDALAELLALGAHGLGGFEDGGVDAEGAWAVRRLGPTLAARFRNDKTPWIPRDFEQLARDLAGALASHRERGGEDPLRPEDVTLYEGRAVWLANDLVDRALGASHEVVAPGPRWCPPTQLDGAPFDARADVWIVGACVYRAVAGTHPFASRGLRATLEAANEPPAPFPDAIARALVPGFQSLVLRALDPDPRARPANGRALLDELDRLRETRPSTESRERPAPRSEPKQSDFSRSEGTTSPQPARPARPPLPSTDTRRGRILPIGVGLTVAVGAVAFALASTSRDDESAPRTSTTVGAMKPLTPAQLDASTCASCHPQQATEWRRSVMGHAATSPLFNALESLIEEQLGRDRDCPSGAGVLRKTTAARACRNVATGHATSGSGGEHWCVSCHAPGEVLEERMPVWDGRAAGPSPDNRPLRDALGPRAMEGIGCTACHLAHGPSTPNTRGFRGNPTWTSFESGRVFSSRPEDLRGIFGIANSGYSLDEAAFVLARGERGTGPGVHRRPEDAMRTYLRSSEFCGSCHDVRLFGSDAVAAPSRGENFKRLRNGYTEWTAYRDREERAGRKAASCQDCHMSAFPAACEPAAAAREGLGGCPPGSRPVARAPGDYPVGWVAIGADAPRPTASHYFTGVDLPLAREYPDDLLGERTLDRGGLPHDPRARRDLLLRAALRFELGEPTRRGGRITIPVELENVGAGHRVPAGFSQEREIWVHLRVTDARDRVLYEVGRVDRDDEDLRDKRVLRVATDPTRVDERGRPVGLFGADIADGVDVPQWSPPPSEGGTRFRGRGLINLQNGFLRCVRCIGVVTSDGRCEPGPGQGRTRADRFEDGDYDLDTGRCDSNLRGEAALFETYFPVGSLDASRGLPKAPDAIIDTRSAPPGVPIRYDYDLDVPGASGPLRVEARLLFRAFPPFLIRAFVDYERAMERLGRRPSGPSIDEQALRRLEVVELARTSREIGP